MWKSAGRAPTFASYTLTFALQLRKKHGKTSVRLINTREYNRRITKTPTHCKTLKNTHITKPTHTHMRTHTHTLQNNINHHSTI